MPTLALSREYGGTHSLYAGSQTGNSGHYYIDRDGTVVMYVRPERVANHVRGYNTRSVGIEAGQHRRYPYWRDSKRTGR